MNAEKLPMTARQSEIEILGWSAFGRGVYRFHGTDTLHGGFYADARLEYDELWRASVESTNYMGDQDRLAGLIAAYAEGM